jgi:hypothetical protein
MQFSGMPMRLTVNLTVKRLRAEQKHSVGQWLGGAVDD